MGLGSGTRDSRSGIRKKPIPDPGSRGQKGHQIPDPDPQHCIFLKASYRHDRALKNFEQSILSSVANPYYSLPVNRCTRANPIPHFRKRLDRDSETQNAVYSTGKGYEIFIVVLERNARTGVHTVLWIGIFNPVLLKSLSSDGMQSCNRYSNQRLKLSPCLFLSYYCNCKKCKHKNVVFSSPWPLVMSGGRWYKIIKEEFIWSAIYLSLQLLVLIFEEGAPGADLRMFLHTSKENLHIFIFNNSTETLLWYQHRISLYMERTIQTHTYRLSFNHLSITHYPPPPSATVPNRISLAPLRRGL